MACPDSKNTIGKKKSEKLGIKIKNLLCGNPWEGDKKKNIQTFIFANVFTIHGSFHFFL